MFSKVTLLLAAALPVALAGPWQATLNACAPYIPINTFQFGLSEGVANGKYFECQYSHAMAAPQYCFYYLSNHSLAIGGNTPIKNHASNAACPKTLPLASTYRINSANATDTQKCVTAKGNYDGAPVQIQDCVFTGQHFQVWKFHGSNIMLDGTNKCLDVTNGVRKNGVKLQVWTCTNDDGNPNQQWQHSGGQILTQPWDRIKWLADTAKCMDLTDGKNTNGNPIQIWNCAGNSNQLWSVNRSQ